MGVAELDGAPIGSGAPGPAAERMQQVLRAAAAAS
jgi:hypothetical protein